MTSRSALSSLSPLLRQSGGGASTIRTTLSTSSPFSSSSMALRRARPSPSPQQALLNAFCFSAPRRSAHTIPQPRQSKENSPSTPDSPTESSSSTSSDADATNDKSTIKSRVQQQPHYQLSFTCRPCDTESTHNISKQGYHHGSVLVTCPGCRNRHVISDHLKIFHDRSVTVEDLLREKGQLIKKGTLGEDGDIEFWEDDAGDAPPKDFKLAAGNGGQGQGQGQ